MINFSRRSFLAGAAAVSPLVSGSRNRDSRRPRHFTRFDATSPQGQAMLNIYAGSGRQDDGRSADSRKESRSAGCSGECTPTGCKPDRRKPREIAHVYQRPPRPDRDLANEMWSTCQAHDGNPQHQPFFLHPGAGCTCSLSSGHQGGQRREDVHAAVLGLFDGRPHQTRHHPEAVPAGERSDVQVVVP